MSETAAPAPNHTSYDSIPYPSFTFPETHPDRLAVIGALMGMQPTPATQSRVLELGCGTGGNIIPMAYTLPTSQFVGVDLAPTAIEQGQRAITALGLKNIELFTRDILEVTTDLGKFDYILAHGVFSWVPDSVREKILTICREQLTPQGVAYISYNAYPGWKILGTVRDMMLYHVRSITNPDTRSVEARKLISFLADVTQKTNLDDPSFQDAFANLVKAYWNHTRNRGDSIFLHDDLEENNRPFYFHEFMSLAHSHGLQFLSEAQVSRSVPSNLPQDVANMLRMMTSNLIDMEQYLDFLRNATFRRTLLVHQELEINRSLSANLPLFQELYIGTGATLPIPEGKTLETINPNDPGILRLESESVTGNLSTDHPLSKAAFIEMAAVSPDYIKFPDLLARSSQRLHGQPNLPDETAAEDEETLATNFLRGYVYSDDLLDLRFTPPPAFYTVSERPLASPVTRYQVQSGEEFVSNLRHQRVLLNPLHRHLIPYLDGRHTHEMLLTVLVQLVTDGLIEIKRDSEGQETVTDPDEARVVMQEELSETLENMAKSGLMAG